MVSTQVNQFIEHGGGGEEKEKQSHQRSCQVESHFQVTGESRCSQEQEGLKQSGLVGDVLAHGSVGGTGWSLRSILTHTTPWVYEK